MAVITRTPIVDDDGSGTTGTILDNAWKQELYAQIDALAAALGSGGGSGPHTMLSATHTDSLAAALVAGDLLAVNAAAKLARLPKGADGQILTLASGLPAWAANVAAQEVGAWVNVPYLASNFTCFGSMVWTVDAADQFTFSYMLIGPHLVLLILNIANSTLSGTASGEIYVQLPFTPQLSTTVYGRYHNGVANGMGIFFVSAGNTKLGIDVYPSGNFTLGTNNQIMQVTMLIPV
jgi:hypothetical protein